MLFDVLAVAGRGPGGCDHGNNHQRRRAYGQCRNDRKFAHGFLQRYLQSTKGRLCSGSRCLSHKFKFSSACERVLTTRARSKRSPDEPTGRANARPMTGSAISGISHRLWLPHVAALMRATPAEALLRRMQFAVEPTQGIRVHRVGCNYILLAMAAPGAFERAMLEAFRSLFHRSGDHPRLTLGAARTSDRQKLWIRCFPHGHFSPTS